MHQGRVVEPNKDGIQFHTGVSKKVGMKCVPRVDDNGADVELLVAERLGGRADVVLAQPHLQNVADRPDEGKAETGTYTF